MAGIVHAEEHVRGSPKSRVTFLIGAVNQAAPGIAAVAAGFANLTAIGMRTAAEMTAGMTAIEAGMMAVGAASALALGVATAEAMKFEKQMKMVQAVSNDMTTKQITTMSNQIKALSIKYGESPAATAEAMQTLGRAGIKDASAQMAIFESAMKMAKIEGMDLQEALEGVVKTTSLFGSDMNNASQFAKDAAKMTEYMVHASQISPTDVPDIMQGLTYVGGAAKEVGWSPTSTMADIAYMAQKGVSGSIAGTSIRGLLTKSVGDQPKYQKAAARLGLDPGFAWTTDAQGKEVARPLYEIVRMVRDAAAAKGLGEREQFELWNAIGMQKTAQQMLKIDPDELQKFNEEMQKSFDLQQKVDTAMSSAAVQFDRFKAAVTVLAINIGEKLLPAVGWLAGGLAHLASWFAQSRVVTWGLFSLLAGGLVIGSVVVMRWLFVALRWVAGEFMTAASNGGLLGAVLGRNATVGDMVTAANVKIAESTAVATGAIQAQTVALEANNVAKMTNMAPIGGAFTPATAGMAASQFNNLTYYQRVAQMRAPYAGQVLGSGYGNYLHYASMTGATGAAGAAATASKAGLMSRLLGVGGPAAMLGGPLGIALMGGAGLYLLAEQQGAFKTSTQKADEAKQKAQENITQANESAQQLTDAYNEEKKKLDNLTEGTEEYNAQLKKVERAKSKAETATKTATKLQEEYNLEIEESTRLNEKYAEAVSNSKKAEAIPVTPPEWPTPPLPEGTDGGKGYLDFLNLDPEQQDKVRKTVDQNAYTDKIKGFKDIIEGRGTTRARYYYSKPQEATGRMTLMSLQNLANQKMHEGGIGPWIEGALGSHYYGAQIAGLDLYASTKQWWDENYGKDQGYATLSGTGKYPKVDSKSMVLGQRKSLSIGGVLSDIFNPSSWQTSYGGGGGIWSLFGGGSSSGTVGETKKAGAQMVTSVKNTGDKSKSHWSQTLQDMTNKTGFFRNDTKTNMDGTKSSTLTNIGEIALGMNALATPISLAIGWFGQLWNAAMNGGGMAGGVVGGLMNTAMSGATALYNATNTAGIVANYAKQSYDSYVASQGETKTSMNSPVKIWKGGTGRGIGSGAVSFPELDPDLFKKRAIETGEAMNTGKGGLTIQTLNVYANTKSDAKYIAEAVRAEIKKVAEVV